MKRQALGEPKGGEAWSSRGAYRRPGAEVKPGAAKPEALEGPKGGETWSSRGA